MYVFFLFQVLFKATFINEEMKLCNKKEQQVGYLSIVLSTNKLTKTIL